MSHVILIYIVRTSFLLFPFSHSTTNYLSYNPICAPYLPPPYLLHHPSMTLRASHPLCGPSPPSMSTHTSSSSISPTSYPVQPQRKLHFYLPSSYISFVQQRIMNVCHIRKSNAYCQLNDSFSSLLCFHHGQYPWGRFLVRDTMAYICHRLGMFFESGIAKTCLPTHMTIGIIGINILTKEELISRCRNSLRRYLISTHMREGFLTLKGLFSSRIFNMCACIRIIREIEDKTFNLIKQYCRML